MLNSLCQVIERLQAGEATLRLMDLSRRNLCLWLPGLVASGGYAVKDDRAQDARLTSQSHRLEDLAVHTNGQNSFRPILEGATRDGHHIELHESDLAPGGMPHPPHHHAHEEMFLLREGVLEVTIAGRASRLDPGSVAFVASNEEHGIRNVGTDHAQYFVLALGRDR
jgi:quercetin dioxygenase-like cupin family protein